MAEVSGKKRQVVRPQNSTDVEDFRLPRWDREGNLINEPSKPQAPTQVEEIEIDDLAMPSVAELETIREEAYSEGYDQGYQTGLNQGRRDGEEAGHKEGFEQGKQQGLAEGLQQGQAQGLEQHKAETQSLKASVAELQKQLSSLIQSEQKDIETALMALSVKIAKQVIQDEWRLQPEHIQPLVHAAVQALPNPDEDLTVYVNPNEIEYVQQIADAHWKVQSSPDVQPGGCQVKTAHSWVDYTLDHRFETAVSQLLSHLRLPTESLSQPVSASMMARPGASIVEDRDEYPESEQAQSPTIENDSVDSSGELQNESEISEFAADDHQAPETENSGPSEMDEALSAQDSTEYLPETSVEHEENATESDGSLEEETTDPQSLSDDEHERKDQ